MKVTGSCLCGEIEFEVVTPLSEFGHCYCKRCQKATGTGRSSVLVASPNQLIWTKGQEKIKRWDMPSALSFTTSFCSVCGSPLPRLTRSSDFAVIPAGSIDSDLPISPSFHEHLASKANWVCIDETHLEMHQGEP